MNRCKQFDFVATVDGYSTVCPTHSPSLSILFNTIPPCSSEIGEGTAVKEEEWRESTFHERYGSAKILRPDALPVANQC